MPKLYLMQLVRRLCLVHRPQWSPQFIANVQRRCARGFSTNCIDIPQERKRDTTTQFENSVKKNKVADYKPLSLNGKEKPRLGDLAANPLWRECVVGWVVSLFYSYFGSTLPGDCLCVSVAWVVSPVPPQLLYCFRCCVAGHFYFLFLVASFYLEESLVLDMHFFLLPLVAISRHLPFITVFSASTTQGSPFLGDSYAIGVAFKVLMLLIAWIMVALFVALVACPPPFSVSSIGYWFISGGSSNFFIEFTLS
ncbi:hypothetical protein L3X38_036577 [Prunus dulcis]|uniref:Uncharacterized protein n=1 Tax=Prunus dulcis TaxID=3755 RepID=A0AAD4YPT3_PRUDU|nr:hypothetical protein L3X38_036577 [Prunus dulcis]